MKAIKIIKNNYGTFWNRNDGTETYSRNIVDLLKYLNIEYEIEEQTE